MSDGYREIPAQYEGRCASCNEEIQLKQTIWWAPGQSAVFCVDCGVDDAESTSPAAGGTRSASLFERETGAERTARVYREQVDRERVVAQLHREETGRRLSALENVTTGIRQDLNLLMRELGVESASEEG